MSLPASNSFKIYAGVEPCSAPYIASPFTCGRILELTCHSCFKFPDEMELFESSYRILVVAKTSLEIDRTIKDAEMLLQLP